jgi:hypothetical protein
MNNTSLPLRQLAFIASIACLLGFALIHPPSVAAAKSAPAAAPKSEESGHLVIVRAANLGAAVIGLSIDGKQVMKLNFNGKYDAPIAAGPHTLSVIPIPNSEHATANELKLTVQPGKTYHYTVKRDDVRVVLK